MLVRPIAAAVAALVSVVSLGVGSSGQAAPVPAVKATAGGSVRVVAVGDIACPSGEAATRTTCRQAATAALARRLDPDAVLALGDLQYTIGNLTAFQKSYDRSWGTLKGITYAVPGNHEYKTSGASGYYSYFTGSPTRSTAPGYYRKKLGKWQGGVRNPQRRRGKCGGGSS